MNTSFFYRFRSFFAQRVYCVGFIEKSDIDLPVKQRFRRISWLRLKNYKHGWFADPFFVSVTPQNIRLLAEEWEYDKKKGRLVLLDISRDNNKFVLNKVFPSLSLDTHLSFPNYFIENNSLYLLPENSESGSLWMYKYNLEKNIVENSKLIINEPLLDAQIVKIDEIYYIMGILLNKGNQDDTKYLRVYSSSHFDGPYRYIQTIENQKREERGAGSIFREKGYYYRPAQCCEGEYGKAVIIYKIWIDNGTLLEREIKRIEPDEFARNGQGIHTYNQMGDLCVIDGRDFRRGLFPRIINQFRLLINRK